MMRSVDLLPQRYRAKRAEKRAVLGVALAGVLVLALMGVWWMVLSSSVDSERDKLATLEQQAGELNRQIAELQRFADLEAEVQAKRAALVQVMAGDLAWPSLLTEVAMVIPGEVWLTTLASSAGMTEGATPVGTEGAAVRISEETPVGRIQFSGQSTSMTGIAEWLIQLAKVDAFTAVWLNSASGGEGAEADATRVFTFDSTLELGDEALSGRFTEVEP
ncbi:MAG: PilN domain-containing protein [Actinomycetota bacterium]